MPFASKEESIDCQLSNQEVLKGLTNGQIRRLRRQPRIVKGSNNQPPKKNPWTDFQPTMKTSDLKDYGMQSRNTKTGPWQLLKH